MSYDRLPLCCIAGFGGIRDTKILYAWHQLGDQCNPKHPAEGVETRGTGCEVRLNSFALYRRQCRWRKASMQKHQKQQKTTYLRALQDCKNTNRNTKQRMHAPYQSQNNATQISHSLVLGHAFHNYRPCHLVRIKPSHVSSCLVHRTPTLLPINRQWHS